ncbi:GGDEF domain-containing response regulator [Marinobacterium sediminicola]|uniref:diguanylate cyclase n=1 Tax=Marinobacterium sediminicola TaxID=518898 RepID=A0ABY1RYY8_9GAMM|nr:response regulator [Marinobacterium sediminicola]ULG68089.1 diguanylate cyclase [Marinobacterium sediminicola]SMR73399.1 diguanylate cyclase (GGDEF) domain-containing protein [Marinobacterium sediminicola]
MPAVLIVEDSQVVIKVLRFIAQRTLLTFDVVFATNATEACRAIASRNDWFAAIVDLNLPDAPNGEMVDFTLENKIPTVVLTGSIGNDKRDALHCQGIVDYVQKEGLYSYQYAVNLINRLYRNRNIKVMVAEDSSVTRSFIVSLLRRHQFQIVEAENGQQALDMILADDSIDILLTDYNMPEMDGFSLIHELRHQHEKTELVIIGLSSADDKYLSAKFIKNGADDFLYKPFSHEEFFCRINHAVEAMERNKELHRMAYTDALTNIHNRRYFIEQARKLLPKAENTQKPLSLAILDIDYFKQVNDEYGHDIGDLVLVSFASSLAKAFSRFVLARTGGEEFCILFSGLTVERAAQLLDAVREQIENSSVEIASGALSFTFSCGVAELPADSLESLMKEADRRLYHAKDSGRNCVVYQG